MGIFNTRPRFDDVQIKQLSGDTITLSGTTNISGTFRYLPGATTGYVLKAIDSSGTVGWQPVSVSADTNTFVTGGTLSGNNLILGWNTGGSASAIDLSALSDSTYWTAGTSGTGSIRVVNGGTTDATGNYSVAAGFNNIVSGEDSFIHSKDSLITGDRSVLLGGQSLTGTTDDTVYVPNLTTRGNHILHSDSTLEVSDIPGTLENIIKGSYTEFNWDGLTTSVLSNNNPSGYTSVILGNLTTYPTREDYGFLSYYGSGYTRTGSPGTGIDFYRDRLVLKSSSNSDGVIFSNNGPKKFWWEIDSKSRMILDDQGQLGLGLNVDGSQNPSEMLHVNGNTLISGELTVQTINTGTTVYLLGANSSGTVIQANDIYGDICAFCSSNISGDTIIGTGTTETDSVHGEGDTVDSTSPYSCTQWCAYRPNGELFGVTTDYETSVKYESNGLIIRCCDSNSGDGGTDYGISISADTTTPGDNPPNVITGLTRPFTVRNARKVSFLNSHKSDVLNSNQVSISDSTLGRIELSTLSSIESSFNSEIYGSNLSTILSSENGFISNSSNASIIGSQYSVLSGVTGSTIIGGNNITGTDNDTVYVPKLNIDTLGGGTSINNLGIDVNGNVVVGTTGGGGGIPEATTATTTTIDFTGQTIYYNAGSPATGNISEDLTGAKLGLIQKIYHNDATEPTYPGGWVLMGDAIYFTSTLNIIYAEWAGGSRVEYWYVQEQ
jgi:hypothetical protein